jgi:hypothetical protein
VTDEELAAIEARAAKATPGPWEWNDNDPPRGPDRFNVDLSVGESDQHIYVDAPRIEDIEFVEHARQDVPTLVAEVRRLRAAIRDLRMSGKWRGDGDFLVDGDAFANAERLLK